MNNNSMKENTLQPSGNVKFTSTMTFTIFVGLLIDLLAFTLILPLFPALLEHYRKNDEEGLYPFLESKVKQCKKWN